MALIGQLVRMASQLPALPPQSPPGEVGPLLRAALHKIFPPKLSRAALSRALQHRSFLVRFLAASALVEGLRALKRGKFSHWESDTWTLGEELRGALPDPQVLISTLHTVQAVHNPEVEADAGRGAGEEEGRMGGSEGESEGEKDSKGKRRRVEGESGEEERAMLKDSDGTERTVGELVRLRALEALALYQVGCTFCTSSLEHFLTFCHLAGAPPWHHGQGKL